MEDTMYNLENSVSEMFNSVSEMFSNEDYSSLSIRRLENMDDVLDFSPTQEETLDIEKVVNEMVAVHELREDAKRRKDWDHFAKLQKHFSTLCVGSPAYSKFKALMEGKAMDEFISKMPDKQEEVTFLTLDEMLFLGHQEEQGRFNAPESKASGFPFWKPVDWFDKRARFFEALSTVKEIKAELNALLMKRTKAIKWLRSAKSPQNRKERAAKLAVRVKELGLRTVAVVMDELDDAERYLETCRKEADILPMWEYVERQNSLKAMIGRTVPAPTRF
jgi:hypothetical protein